MLRLLFSVNGLERTERSDVTAVFEIVIGIEFTAFLRNAGELVVKVFAVILIIVRTVDRVIDDEERQYFLLQLEEAVIDI